MILNGKIIGRYGIRISDVARDHDWGETDWDAIQEESGELARAILKNNREEFIDAIGDMMVVLTNLAALEGLKVEDCVVSAYDVIKSRQGEMVNGTFVKRVNDHVASTL